MSNSTISLSQKIPLRCLLFALTLFLNTPSYGQQFGLSLATDSVPQSDERILFLGYRGSLFPDQHQDAHRHKRENALPFRAMDETVLSDKNRIWLYSGIILTSGILIIEITEEF